LGPLYIRAYKQIQLFSLFLQNRPVSLPVQHNFVSTNLKKIYLFNVSYKVKKQLNESRLSLI